MQEPAGLPPVFIPEQAAVAERSAGQRLVFLYAPQVEKELRKVMGLRPSQVTYRWAYHPARRLHVLFAFWPLTDETGVQVGLAIPEETGAPVLAALEQGAALYLTCEPLESAEERNLTDGEIDALLAGVTVHLPQHRFRGRSMRQK